MGYADNMRELLRPLGVYRLDGGCSGEELNVVGEELDLSFESAETALREMLLATAQDDGLAAWEELFPYRPLRNDADGRRMAIAALMRIDGRSFTQAALNDTLSGCGFTAVAEEGSEPMTVVVHFEDVRGVPPDFAELSKRIEDILPCHLNVSYYFVYSSWADIESAGLTWGELDALELSWWEFERYDFTKKIST